MKNEQIKNMITSFFFLILLTGTISLIRPNEYGTIKKFLNSEGLGRRCSKKRKP